MHEIKSMLKTLLDKTNGNKGQVTTTSTLEQFRVEFNKLQTDVSGIEEVV